MPLGLQQHHLDFEIIETGNLKTLVFIDSSSYMEEPESPLLEITPPGHSKYFLVNVTARQVNTFNSSTIGLNTAFDQSCLSELVDGIWSFKYKICPYKYVYVCKKVMRVTNILLKLKSLYEKIDLEKDNTVSDSTITKINILIDGAVALADSDSDAASKYYRAADKMLDRELNKFCKICK